MIIKQLVEQKTKQILNVIVGLLLVSAIVLILAINYLMQAFSEERFIASKETELIAIGNKFLNTIDFLSEQAKKFAISKNLNDLEPFWHEHDLRKTQENLLKRLVYLKASPEEIDLMIEAKNKSDELLIVQINAIKLITESLGTSHAKINQTIQKYTLAPTEQKLKPTEKINRAKQILFNQHYDDLRKKILIPVLQFEKATQERIYKETNYAQYNTNIGLFSTIALATLILFLLINLFWLKYLSTHHR